MCYLLRSCDAAFLWQHSTRCYSHFAVFSFTARYSARQSGSCKKGPKGVNSGKEARHPILFCLFPPNVFVPSLNFAIKANFRKLLYC